jgi:hypothetical protein
VRALSGKSLSFKLLLAAAGVLAAIAVTGATAADFEGDSGPCAETPGEGALLRCPTGFVGQKYEVAIESEEGSGCTSPGNPYVWYEVVNSSLPPGLTMSRAGVISGIPTRAGFTRFWLWNHDLTEAQGGPGWCQNEDRSEREFSIYIDPALEIENESLEGPTIGQPYANTLTASRVTSLDPTVKAPASPTWSIQSGALPQGLALSPQGALTGSPTAEGSYGVTVKAVDGSTTNMKAFALNVRQPVVVTSPAASARPRSEVGIRVTTTARATGGTGKYIWSVGSGVLPTGVTLDSATGVISGTPTSAGNFAFAVTATDDEKRTGTAGFGLTVAPRLAIKTAKLKAGSVGRAYRARVQTAGGVRPLKWKLRGKLPAGVRFSRALGAFAGTPSRAGTFAVVVEARDALGAKALRRLALRVKT